MAAGWDNGTMLSWNRGAYTTVGLLGETTTVGCALLAFATASRSDAGREEGVDKVSPGGVFDLEGGDDLTTTKGLESTPRGELQGDGISIVLLLLLLLLPVCTRGRGVCQQRPGGVLCRHENLSCPHCPPQKRPLSLRQQWGRQAAWQPAHL